MKSGADHYARVGTIVGGARDLCGAGLADYLDAACSGDPSVRAEVVELLALAGDDDPGAALAEPAVEGTRRALEGLVDGATRAWLPDKIGPYRIQRQLGQGGMGVVFEAEQASPRRRVALKLLHPMQATAARLRRFRHEVEMLGRLQHPGIVSIFEAGTFDLGRGPQPFFAMELVEGVDIRTHCERRHQSRAPLGEACSRASPELIELLARISDAVHFAHEHGIVHRDLKPENVLVDRQGQPRILDFGIASIIEHSAKLSSLVTVEGQLVGTLTYMAPELLRQSAGAITRQVDVYALGVLGFELLVGRLPREIEGLSLPQAIERLSSSAPLHAGTFDSSLRGDLETVLGKALESEPARRYASAAALASDLRRHLAHQPIQARPQSRFYLAQKFTRRHKGLVGGVVATLLVALAGTVMALRGAREAGARARELERTVYRMTIARAHSSVQQQDYAAAEATLDLAPAAHRNWEYDHLRARLVKHIDEWEAPAPLTTAPVFDLEGRRMFALMSDGAIGTWDTSSGELRGRLALEGDLTPPTECTGAAVLNGPSLRFAVLSAERDVVIGDLETGARSCALPGPAVVHAWDPAGRWLLYSAGEKTCLWDGTRSRVLTDEAASQGAFDHAGERIALASGRRIALFDATTGKRSSELTLDDQILDLSFAPDDETLAAAGYYRNAYLLDGRTLDVDERLVGHRDIVHSVRWNQDGSRLITASADRTVRIWDMRRRETSQVCTSDDGGDSSACALPDSEHVLVAGARVRRFPLQDPNVLRGHASFVYRLAFSPDGSMLASSGYREPVVHVWDLDLGRSLWRLAAPRTGEDGHFGQAPVVAFSTDGRRLVAASSAESLSWDVRTGAVLEASSGTEPVARFFETLGRPAWEAFGGRAMSTDGKRGVRFNESVVEVFDLDVPFSLRQQEDPGFASFTITGHLAGHVGTVYCAAFSPDGSRIATGGNDATVRVWDAGTGEDLLVLRGHEQYVMDVAFSPDGTRLASASGDTTIRLWDTKPLPERRALGGR